MPGRSFNRLPASGPMAEQLEQERKAAMGAAAEEYNIEIQTLGQQFLTDEQYQNKAAQINGKHRLKALQMNREWDQRITQIQEYEKLGAQGTITPEQSSRAQFGLSGFNVPKRQTPNYWAEHRSLLQERERLNQMLDSWDFHKGKWKQVKELYTKGKKKDQVSKRGREATSLEVERIEAVQGIISQLDTYEFSLLQQLDPQQRKVNQLSRAARMGPRVSGTPGVGGKRTRIPLGVDRAKDPVERFKTPGFKITKEKAMQQARQQLGPNANRERVISLAKQIYGSTR